MGVSLDLWCIWSDRVHIDGVYDHARPSRVVCMPSMSLCVDYMVIFILYSTTVVY